MHRMFPRRLLPAACRLLPVAVLWQMLPFSIFSFFSGHRTWQANTHVCELYMPVCAGTKIYAQLCLTFEVIAEIGRQTSDQDSKSKTKFLFLTMSCKPVAQH